MRKGKKPTKGEHNSTLEKETHSPTESGQSQKPLKNSGTGKQTSGGGGEGLAGDSGPEMGVVPFLKQRGEKSPKLNKERGDKEEGPEFGFYGEKGGVGENKPTPGRALRCQLTIKNTKTTVNNLGHGDQPGGGDVPR